jgi:membrane protein DedA with SNARE-associated domain
MNFISEGVRYFLSNWGYWAIVAGIVGENAGLPVPGEAVLIAASFLAKKGTLSLPWVIVIGIAAAITGNMVGYWLGHSFGNTLLHWFRRIGHLDDVDIQVARNLIRHRGGTTIFFARFIFGLRTIAGVLAGMLSMEWRRFMAFNALGAAVWATGMSFVGYGFGASLKDFQQYFEYVSWLLATILFLIGYWLWRRYKRSFAEGRSKQATA